MRHGTSNRRHNNRSRNNNGRRNNQQRTQVYDSNGPDVRIRGTAHQVAEKYLTLAKDATSAGDRIVAENYYQHAEHYIRIIGENNGKFESEQASDFDGMQSGDGNGNSNNRDNGHNNQSDQPKKVTKKVAKSEDDLSLPDSILGPDVKVKSNKADQEEVVD
tara:strand:- start:26657 stop:27139 length:483 start_codon:yes stop_codon:yes gene_type:complete